MLPECRTRGPTLKGLFESDTPDEFMFYPCYKEFGEPCLGNVHPLHAMLCVEKPLAIIPDDVDASAAYVEALAKHGEPLRRIEHDSFQTEMNQRRLGTRGVP